MRESIKTAFLGSVAIMSVALLGLLTVISVYMQSEQMEGDVQELLEAQGAAINKMAEDIRAVMQKISRMSEELSAASQELSSTAEQSLTNMNSMASSVGEMAEGVKQQESHIVDTAS